MMELFKCLFGVLFLVGGAAAQLSYGFPYLSESREVVKKQISKVPPPDKCRLDEDEKVQCGAPDVTPDQCEEINCCFDGQRCYYGKAVTVQCTRDGQFVVVVAREATIPPIDVTSVSLLEMNDDVCSPTDTSSTFIVFQFPVTACGTTLKEEESYVVYENHMSSSYEVGIGPRGSITRDSHFELLFQCRYSGTAVQALVLEVNDVPPPIPVAAIGPLRVELRLGSGQCQTKGCIEEDAAYNTFYMESDYPLTKVLRQPVYVEVRILERSDPTLVLNLERCWATASPDPRSLPQWDLLVDGCPYHDDRYLTMTLPVGGSSGLEFPSHHRRFVMRMFTFVDPEHYTPLNNMVFIHCNTAVCHPSSSTSCEPLCHRQRRAADPASEAKDPSRPKTLVSSGKVILIEETSLTSSPDTKQT